MFAFSFPESFPELFFDFLEVVDVGYQDYLYDSYHSLLETLQTFSLLRHNNDLSYLYCIQLNTHSVIFQFFMPL
jgi:hypothetical protein